MVQTYQHLPESIFSYLHYLPIYTIYHDLKIEELSANNSLLVKRGLVPSRDSKKKDQLKLQLVLIVIDKPTLVQVVNQFVH